MLSLINEEVSMTTNIHPNRHRQGMRAALARLERLSPGITHGSTANLPEGFLEVETAGMPEAELRGRRNLLAHLATLIADWKTDGKSTVDFGPVLGELHTLPDEDIVMARPPAAVTYVAFGGRAPRLISLPGATVEGFYIREVVTSGYFAAEITLVCHDPSWHELDGIRYSEALRTGSRAAIGVIPVGQRFSVNDGQFYFKGDSRLLGDPLLAEAVKAIGVAVANNFDSEHAYTPPVYRR